MASFTFMSLTRSTQMCNTCNNVIIISELIQNEIHITHMHSIYSADIHTSHYILTSSSGHESRCKAQAEKQVKFELGSWLAGKSPHYQTDGTRRLNPAKTWSGPHGISPERGKEYTNPAKQFSFGTTNFTFINGNIY